MVIARLIDLGYDLVLGSDPPHTLFLGCGSKNGVHQPNLVLK